MLSLLDLDSEWPPEVVLLAGWKGNKDLRLFLDCKVVLEVEDDETDLVYNEQQLRRAQEINSSHLYLSNVIL